MQPQSDPVTYKHAAFISYSRKNESFAGRLEQALESYRPPKDLGVGRSYLDVFRDKADFTAGEYHQSLEKHLKDSAKLIVVCSPEARASRYVNDEIERFVKLRGAEHIIPILVSGVPNNEAGPGQEAQMAFPPALCEVMAMPLAANYLGFDARRDRVDKGAYADAWYTTLANIYDVSRGEIEQREKKRRARTRRIIYGALSGSVAVLSVLLVFALLSRSRAVAAEADALRQRDIAKEQRNLAVNAQQEAETQRNLAVEARNEAERQKDAAVEARKAEEKQRGLAEEAARQEAIARRNAERAAELERQARLEAEANLRLATSRQLAAQSGQALVRTNASEALGAYDPQRGVLLALEALNRAQTPEGVRALRESLGTLAGRAQTSTLVRGRSLSLGALGPGGDWAVASFLAQEGTEFVTKTVLIDPRTGTEMDSPPDGSGPAALRPPPDWLPASESKKAIAYSADGSLLLALDEGRLNVWDARRRQLSHTVVLGAGTTALAPGGAWVATLSGANEISVRDVAANRLVARRRVGEDFSSIAVSERGDFVAAGSMSEVRVWEVRGWRQVARLPHEWSLQAMAFSSDGVWLTTVTHDVSKDPADPGATALVGSTVRVWHVKEGRLVTEEALAAHGGIDSVAFSPDGRWLAAAGPAYAAPDTPAGESGGDDTTLRLWLLTPDDLRRTACASLQRNLSNSEWKKFISRKREKLTCPGLPVPDE
jgi:hypothetical protein